MSVELSRDDLFCLVGWGAFVKHSPVPEGLGEQWDERDAALFERISEVLVGLGE